MSPQSIWLSLSLGLESECAILEFCSSIMPQSCTTQGLSSQFEKDVWNCDEHGNNRGKCVCKGKEGGLLCGCGHACVTYAGCRTLVCKLICECVCVYQCHRCNGRSSTCSSYSLSFIKRCVIKCFTWLVLLFNFLQEKKSFLHNGIRNLILLSDMICELVGRVRETKCVSLCQAATIILTNNKYMSIVRIGTGKLWYMVKRNCF